MLFNAGNSAKKNSLAVQITNAMLFFFLFLVKESQCTIYPTKLNYTFGYISDLNVGLPIDFGKIFFPI